MWLLLCSRGVIMEKIEKKDMDKIHNYLATKLFNDTWGLLDKTDRTPEEDVLMIHTAHASLFHWLQFGEAKNFSIGEWQVSRVYAELKMGESALKHGLANVDLCKKNNISGFELGYAYESVARAYKILGKVNLKEEYLNKAYSEVENISDAEEKEYLIKDLETI